MDAIVKSSSTRRRKKDGIDLEQMADQEIEEMRRRMAQAAEADNEGRKRGEPARHKLKLLPEVVALLNKSNLKESIVDPESNILEAVRFFLEPLSDGSLPAYDIQKELFAALAKLPINKDTLVASGIGKVIMFYIKSKRPELTIKRQAERLFTDWTRPILRRTDDYRKKEFKQADFDPTYVYPILEVTFRLTHAQTKGRYWQRCCQQPSGCPSCCKEEGPRGSKGIPARSYGDWSHDVRYRANKPCHLQRGQQLQKRCGHSEDSEGEAGWRQALRVHDHFRVHFELQIGVRGVLVHAWEGIVSQTAYGGVSKLACWPIGWHHMNEHCIRILRQRYHASPCLPASLHHGPLDVCCLSYVEGSAKPTSQYNVVELLRMPNREWPHRKRGAEHPHTRINEVHISRLHVK